jgi:flagellar biosynthesis/type III secretory pathway M-ring protein FliF/YscJ
METEQLQPLTEVLTEITRRSNSELIYFFIIILVALILVLIPFYKIYTNHMNEKQKISDRKEKNREARNAEERREILTVITTNTKALNELTTFIDILSKSTENNFKIFDKRLRNLSKDISDSRTGYNPMDLPPSYSSNKRELPPGA